MTGSLSRGIALFLVDAGVWHKKSGPMAAALTARISGKVRHGRTGIACSESAAQRGRTSANAAITSSESFTTPFFLLTWGRERHHIVATVASIF